MLSLSVSGEETRKMKCPRESPACNKPKQLWQNDCFCGQTAELSRANLGRRVRRHNNYQKHITTPSPALFRLFLNHKVHSLSLSRLSGYENFCFLSFSLGTPAIFLPEIVNDNTCWGSYLFIPRISGCSLCEILRPHRGTKCTVAACEASI